MSNTFQRTFQHLVDANTVLQSVIPPLPPLQRAPTQAPSSLPAPALSPPSPTDQEIKIIQGRTYSSKNLLHAGHRYSILLYILFYERKIQKSHLCVSLSLCRHSVHLLGDCRHSVHRHSVFRHSVHRQSVHRHSVLYPCIWWYTRRELIVCPNACLNIVCGHFLHLKMFIAPFIRITG